MPGKGKGKKESFHKSKSQRKDEMARKRDERAIRNAHRKDAKQKKALDSYLADDENYVSFSNQLKKLGLELRDIPGDGYVNHKYYNDYNTNLHSGSYQYSIE